MKFDNRKTTINIWLQRLMATIVFTPILFVILFSRKFRQPVMGIDRDIYLVVTVLLYTGLLAWQAMIRPAYIYFNDNGEKIILRFYRVSALSRKKHSVEIPKKQFIRYEIRRFFPGRESIILYRKMPEGIARYPEISLSIVSRTDREKIKRALDQYVKSVD